MAGNRLDLIATKLNYFSMTIGKIIFFTSRRKGAFIICFCFVLFVCLSVFVFVLFACLFFFVLVVLVRK